ncbi:MAG: 6-phospho-beta-glucosidase, partial [Vallitaleaceae bacterium]|nr:6-phospho-beta-glucosidase [Vallitaleaceae bacterium]
MKKLKIVVIGGGSSYTPELVEGIIKKQESLPVGEIVLVDILEGEEKIKINEGLVKRMFAHANLDTKIYASLDRRKALQGADFIMTQFRVGGLKARKLDEEIPLKYGMIGQETTGIGGFFKALRTIPVMMELCKEIEEICPDAWLINFTNPSGIITEVVSTRTKVKSIGLCNVPINMVYEAASLLGAEAQEVHCNFIGLNHLSFMNRCVYHGKDVLAQILDQAVQNSQEVDEEDQAEGTEKVEKAGLVKNINKISEADSLAKRLGFMLSPYLQYFYFENVMLAEEKENVRSGKGTRAEQVMRVEKDLFALYQKADLDRKPIELTKRGGSRYSEAAISLIDSIYNDRGDLQVVNTLNRGSITNLPELASVEVNCIINRHGASPVANG